MDAFNIGPSAQMTLKDINEKLETAQNDSAYTSESTSKAESFWDYLKTCEEYYLNGDYKEDYHHDYENMFALYFLNELVNQGHLSGILRTVFGLPDSKITSEQAKEFQLFLWVAGDGTIYAFSKYCQLDIEWTLVLVYYLYYKVLPWKKHPFVAAPSNEGNFSNRTVPSKAKIAIIGDWGTGLWSDGETPKCPSQLVIEGVVAQDPDYIIHLGDVYYAGTKREENNNFLDRIPAKYHNKFYTMNSNHEMYDGANGLMKTTLSDARFTHQGGSTYFSFEVGDWIIVGLDSAYYDESPLYMDGIIATSKGGQEQLELLKKAYNSGKQIMLCTHHNGIEVAKDGPTPNNPLWNQVLNTVAPHIPDVWYWGHVHNGVVYSEDLSIYEGKTSKNGNKPRMRCCGHASIPFGNGSYLEPLMGGNDPEVLYYSHTKMPNPTSNVQDHRVLNGFAIVEINNSELTESFYEVAFDNGLVVTKKWSY
ncbi:MAG: metallophosphoesterase [Flavobacteriaceae bacterium]|nr:metallophosphoesterase [Flavobacteriaceae bacterium]